MYKATEQLTQSKMNFQFLISMKHRTREPSATVLRLVVEQATFSRKQEALLPQTDRAMRYVTQDLAHGSTTVETRCAANAQQIKVMELRVAAD